MRSRPWLRATSLLFAAAAISAQVQSQQLYRWVDEQGRVQMSDRPPPQGSGSLTQQELRKDAVPAQQVKEAQDRAAKDRERLKTAQTERQKAALVPASAASAPKAAASSGFADENDKSLPRRASPEDCRAWRAEYRRNLSCYGPYRTANGGIKAEAFAICGPEVLDPEFECGNR